MDFRQATDELLAAITHQQVANRLGVSVASIRQARLRAGAKAHRSPPPRWEEEVATLAEEQADRLLRLAKALDKQRFKLESQRRKQAK